MLELLHYMTFWCLPISLKAGFILNSARSRPKPKVLITKISHPFYNKAHCKKFQNIYDGKWFKTMSIPF